MAIHVVLYQPEIPQNTGNILRTCAATNATLHLIKPLGFSLDEKYIKRSSANHAHEAEFKVYDNWEDFTNQNQGDYVFLTRYGKNPPSTHDFSQVDKQTYLIFGKESTGIPKEILKAYMASCYRLPMRADARSLNLSNVVAIMVYEVLRQQDYPNLSFVEVQKGQGFLDH